MSEQEQQPDQPQGQDEAVHAVQPGSCSTRRMVSPTWTSRSPTPERALVDPDAVHAAPVGAAEVGVDQRPAPGLEPGVMARHPRIGEHEAVVGRLPSVSGVPVDLDRALGCRRATDDAQARLRRGRRGPAEDERLGAVAADPAG